MGDVVECQNDDRRGKKRRRKTVLKNARKYGKKGYFGRGVKLNEDTYQYYVRVLEIYNEGFPSEEEKVLFVNNVLEETKSEELNYSSNQLGCRVIETLLPFANTENFNRFLDAISSDLRICCTDRFASHVLQTLFKLSFKKSATESEEKLREHYKNFSIKVGKFLLNNLEDFIEDVFANYLIREVFYTFADIEKDITNKKQTETAIEHANISDIYSNIVTDFANRLILWPHFKDLPYNEQSSGLLQVLLIALQKVNCKLMRKFCKKLCKESFAAADDETNDIKYVFKSKSALMLFETVISVASPKIYTKLYVKYFCQNLTVLSTRKDTNFSVQKLINYCKDKTDFERIFDELANSFAQIIEGGFTGVIVALANACKKFATKQGNFVQILQKSLNCIESQERQVAFGKCLIYMIPYEKLSTNDQRRFINIHGSLILQTMLGYNKPIKLVQSLLAMNSNELRHLFCDEKGSHIMDAYIKNCLNGFIGEKNREKLVWRLQGTYQELAASKYGSRSLESVWSSANMKQKLKIMEELAYKDQLWRNTPCGKIIANKFKLQLYKRNAEEWKQSWNQAEKKKELFANLLT